MRNNPTTVVTVTVDLVTNQDTYSLNTDSSFAGKVVNRLFVVRKSGKSINKKTVVSDGSGFKSLFLELKYDGISSAVVMPLELVYLKTTQGNCIGFLVEMPLTWASCKIISYDPSVVVTGEVVELVVEFQQ